MSHVFFSPSGLAHLGEGGGIMSDWKREAAMYERHEYYECSALSAQLEQPELKLQHSRVHEPELDQSTISVERCQ